MLMPKTISLVQQGSVNEVAKQFGEYTEQDLKALLNDTDQYGHTLLYFAAKAKKHEICRFLVNKGASIQKVIEKARQNSVSDPSALEIITFMRSYQAKSPTAHARHKGYFSFLKPSASEPDLKSRRDSTEHPESYSAAETKFSAETKSRRDSLQFDIESDASQDSSRRFSRDSSHGSSCDVEQSDSDQDSAHPKHVHESTFVRKNKAKFIRIGTTLLEALYEAQKIDLSLHGHYDRLPNWMADISYGLYNKLGLDEEHIRQNAFLASSSSFLNSLNLAPQIVTTVAEKLNLKEVSRASHQRARQDYLASLICMAWAIKKQSELQNESFTRGSYKIIDPQNRLYDCFLEYVKLVNRQEDPEYVLPFGNYLLQLPEQTVRVLVGEAPGRSIFTANPYAYTRTPKSYLPLSALSSHYPNDEAQWGIDIRFLADEIALELLPGNFSHILFGAVSCKEKRCTFVKFEPEGLGNPIEVIGHGISFAKSGHVSGADRREKDIDSELKKIYEKFVATTQLPKKSKTIHGMLEDLTQSTHFDAEKIKEEFLLVARTKFDIETLPIRTGNEVILDFTKFSTDEEVVADAGDAAFVRVDTSSLTDIKDDWFLDDDADITLEEGAIALEEGAIAALEPSVQRAPAVAGLGTPPGSFDLTRSHLFHPQTNKMIAFSAPAAPFAHTPGGSVVLSQPASQPASKNTTPSDSPMDSQPGLNIQTGLMRITTEADAAAAERIDTRALIFGDDWVQIEFEIIDAKPAAAEPKAAESTAAESVSTLKKSQNYSNLRLLTMDTVESDDSVGLQFQMD